MSDDSRPDVLNQMEIEAYVCAIEKSGIEELGSIGWLDKHDRIKQLTVQSVIQALSNREETVKEALITHEKLKVLVHDLILIELWREEILPKLTTKQAVSQCFIFYPILYHESCCINLLETVMYHPESSDTLGEAIIDLTDYCLRLMNFFVTAENDDDIDEEDQKKDELISGQISRRAMFKNSFKALTTLRYIIENVDSLGSGLVSRLIVSSDAPMLLTELLLQKPWRRENWQSGKVTEYEPTTDTWKELDPSEYVMLSRVEIQAWLALYLLLKNNTILGIYELYDSRKNQLLKLRPFLNDMTLDQLPILGELQLFLNQLAVQSGPCAPSKSPLLLEMIAPIRDSLETEFKKNHKNLVKVYKRELVDASKDVFLEKALKLSTSYDLDTFQSTRPTIGKCGNCGKDAEKRCSKCKREAYCSRECQVAHWKMHKVNCGNEN